jgi:tetratricopeptide (TPR) repeat protein
MKSKTKIGWAGLVLSVCLMLAASGCSQLKARDQLNKGVSAYRGGQYQTSVEHFKRAVEFDPELINARLYLATAYSIQYVPGADTDENLRMGELAIEEFENVLATDPNNLNSIIGIAQLYFNMKRMDEAKEFRRRQISIAPSNPEELAEEELAELAGAYYAIGVVDWTLTYQPRMALKVRLGLRGDQPFPRAALRADLTERNMPLIEEGMENLNKAIELRPDYDDAMAYLNLLYRERADLVDTEEEREELLATADMWIAKTLEIKKARAEEEEAERSQAGG